MPPRTPQRQRTPRPRGYDPTASISAASEARRLPLDESNPNANEVKKSEQATEKKSNANDDLKKLIEALKSKMQANQGLGYQKKTPPQPKPKTPWNRSIGPVGWAPKPAYTILTRISNHEKIPTQSDKTPDLTIKALPHSFIYRPGANGIKVDKLDVKSGKQIGWG